MTTPAMNGTPCLACLEAPRSVGILCVSCEAMRIDRNRPLDPTIEVRAIPQDVYVRLVAHEAKHAADKRAASLQTSALPLRARFKLAFFRAWRTLRGVEP